MAVESKEADSAIWFIRMARRHHLACAAGRRMQLLARWRHWTRRRLVPRDKRIGTTTHQCDAHTSSSQLGRQRGIAFGAHSCDGLAEPRRDDRASE